MTKAAPQEAKAVPPDGTRVRRTRWRVWTLLALAVGVFAPLTYLSVAGATFRVPHWVAAQVERAVNDRLAGGRLDVASVDLIFDRNLRPRVQMRNVAVFDQNETAIATLDRVSARLSAEQLVRGSATMNALNISGAIVTVRRDAQGRFNLVFGGGPATTGDLATVLDSLAQSFTTEPLAALGEVTADGVTISLEDARSGRIWQVTGGRVGFQNQADRLRIEVEAEVFNGTEDLARTAITFEIEKGSSRATLTASFGDALASDIAAQSPVLSFLGVLDARISGALKTTIGDDGAIEGLAGTISLAEGALRPTPDTPPIPFERGEAFIDYDPAAQMLSFRQLAFESETVSLTAEGTALLQDFRGRWPSSLVGQMRLSDLELQPKGVFAEPMRFDRGALEFRARLDPFAVDIGQVSLGPPEQRLLASGTVRARSNGWEAGVDLRLNQIAPQDVLTLWPVAVAKGARRWVTKNVISGQIGDLTAALRLAPGQAPRASLSFLYDDATVQAIRFLPPVTGASGYASFDGQSFTTVIEKGQVAAPDGGVVDISGSYFRVPDVTAKVDIGEVNLLTQSTLSAALSLLNQPPLSLLDKAGRTIDDVTGAVSTEATLRFEMRDKIAIEDVSYQVSGTLRDVRSDRLVKDRLLTANRLTLSADGAQLAMSGTARLDGLPLTGTWRQPLGPEAERRSTLTGSVELSPQFLDVFAISLPPGTLRGEGTGEITVALAEETAPTFELSSDLRGVGLRLPSLGWSKGTGSGGRLLVSGRLGPVPRLDRVSLSAPGLSLSGSVSLNPGGGLAQARFSRVRVGEWLDAPVTLSGRGRGAPPGILVNSGRVDLRKASFGGGTAETGPMVLRLDRLILSEGIVLTGFRGDFNAGRGLNGQFSAAVNGAASISGQTIATASGAAIQIRSPRAGEVFASAGILRNARGGAMTLSLIPTDQAGVYNGRLEIQNTRIVEAPAMTELLNAISIVGLIDQVNTGGIRMSDVEAEFQLSPEVLTLYGLSAVGPSLGISLDGRYGMRSKRLDMQGVVSPVYFLNGIGQIFSRGRDGLFGFSFRLTGAANNPRVSVNPLSILTPGAFREIFRRPPPTPSQ